MADEKVGSSDMTGNKSEQNVYTKGNEKQRKQYQTNEASEPNAASGTVAPSKYKSELDVCRI
jgi:hypothetical protein